MTEDEAFLDFIACFPDKDNNGRVTYTQWCDFYAAVSLCVPEDKDFYTLMKQAWK